MTHTKYATHALVLHRFETGEADVVLLLLTPDFGIISVHAQGARLETAKMRAHIQTYNLAYVTLVRGKHTWRLTGVDGNEETPARLTGEYLNAFARISTFVRRMTPKEDASMDIFDAVRALRMGLPVCIGKEAIENRELETVARILSALGYLPVNVLEQYTTPLTLSRVVNTAIKESHL